MKLIKRHKFTIFVILMYILLVVFAYFLNQTFFSNNNRPQWGDRLDGIETVEITAEQYANMKLEIKQDDNVEEVSYKLNGKTVNVIITVVDKLSKANAKKIGDKVLKGFDEEQLAFYDFQIFIKKNDVTQNDFPIIGYKHNTSKKLVWSKDRQVEKQ